MGLDALNNVTAPDNQPSAASTLDGVVPGTRCIVDVSNAAIYWQVKQGKGHAYADWAPPNGVYMSPGSRRIPMEGAIYGFRFWAAVKAANLPAGGQQAQVTVVIV